MSSLILLEAYKTSKRLIISQGKHTLPAHGTDLSHILTNNGAKSRSGWTTIQKLNENVHPNLLLLLIHTKVQCGKGLLTVDKIPTSCVLLFKV